MMFCKSQLCIGVVFSLILQGIAQNDTFSNDTAHSVTDQTLLNTNFENMASPDFAKLPDSSKKIMVDIITNKCSRQYSITCLKLDFSRLIDKLGRTKSFQIFPGFSVVNTDNSTTNKNDIPEEVAVSFVRSNNDDSGSELNMYLFRKLSKYFSSLSLRVNLLDNPIIQNLKDFTYSAISGFFNPFDESGRSKKGKQDMQAAAWSAAMLAALGFSGLAALAGKAMLTGALALVLSLICLLKGCGGGHKASHYEIITKPALHDVEHIGLSGSISNAPYSSYARHLIQDRVIPALNILDTDSSDEKDLVREVIPVHAYQIPPNYGPSALIHK